MTVKSDNVIRLDEIKHNISALLEAGEQVRNGKKIDCTDVIKLSKRELAALFFKIGRDVNLRDFCIEINDELYRCFEDYQNKLPQRGQSRRAYQGVTLRVSGFFCNTINSSKTVTYLAIILALSFIPTVTLLKYMMAPRVQLDTLTIGILSDPQDKDALKNYLEDSLKSNNIANFFKEDAIEIVIQGGSKTSYQETKEKIRSQEWDIIFALSPVLSLYAKENGYTWVATMFPGSDTYRAGLFVRKDSSIQSVDDINSNTSIALGSIADSASSFFIPVYDLFGKRLRVFPGNRGAEIIRMVETGQVDIGAAAISDNRIRENQNLRIILASREIPGSGVYISPSLSESDQRIIKREMLLAPVEIQKDFNYAAGNEHDYTEFKKIMSRVEEILICSDFNVEVVTLYCPDRIQLIQSRVSSWRADSDGYWFSTNDSSDGRISHSIFMEDRILQEVLNEGNPDSLLGKEIQVKAPVLRENEGSRSVIRISQSSQVSILD
jgi:ABC-type phosphate/phosphonate transport system substrate-binding protein